MLTELIVEICECERRTELVRTVLARLEEFEPYAGTLFLIQLLSGWTRVAAEKSRIRT